MSSSPRREIKTRDKKWAQNLAKFVATKTNLTPNMISVLSVFFAILACGAYCLYRTDFIPVKYSFIIPILAILFMQLRLLCNLIDGMVAIEGGKKSAVGDIYNEFPDRLSDSFIIIGAGIAGGTETSLILSLVAALLAMFTAYTRLLGGAVGVKQYFSGPMAKQHRMALLTVFTLICVISPIKPDINLQVYPIALAVIIAGCIVTVWRRVSYIARDLKEKNSEQ